MSAKTPVKPHGSGCTVTIDASPGATRTEIVGVNQWRAALQVKIAAEPREGEANEELLSFLAERLGVAKSDIIVMKGEKSSKKVLYLPVAAEKAASILGVT